MRSIGIKICSRLPKIVIASDTACLCVWIPIIFISTLEWKGLIFSILNTQKSQLPVNKFILACHRAAGSDLINKEETVFDPSRHNLKFDLDKKKGIG
jgi:hypothetical protein